MTKVYTLFIVNIWKCVASVIEQQFHYIDLWEKSWRYSMEFLPYVSVINIDVSLKETFAKYKDIIKRYESIPRTFEYASKALKPYEEFLGE